MYTHAPNFIDTLNTNSKYCFKTVTIQNRLYWSVFDPDDLENLAAKDRRPCLVEKKTITDPTAHRNTLRT